MKSLNTARLSEIVKKRPKATLMPCAFIAGLLTSYAMPPWSIPLYLFIGMSAFYLTLHAAQTTKQAALIGFLFGFGFFLNGLEWIGNALLVEGNQFAWVYPLAICGLPTILSLYYAIAATLVKKYTPNLSSICAAITFICIFAFTDWLRGHLFTGFPWNLFAYSWSEHLPLLQLLHYGNVYFLNILSIVWAIIPAIVALNKNNRKKILFLTIFLIFSITAPYTLGYIYLNNHPTQFQPGWNATIVQPNIAQSEKWKRDKLQRNFDTLTELSHPINTNKEEQNLIIWPETAASIYTLRAPQNTQKIVGLLNNNSPTYLITGLLNHEPDEGFSNEIVLIDKQGIHNTYKKTKLVPFGEFIPFQKWIPIAPVTNFKGFGEGSGPVIYQTPANKNSTPLNYRALICYEIIFPGLTQNYEGKYPQLIINATNDAWYGDSPGPHQHFTHARYRAIEAGLPVIRAANTGISAIIDPYGRIIDSLPINKKGNLHTPIPKPTNKNGQTPWKQNTLFIVFLMLGTAIILYFRIGKNRKN